MHICSFLPSATEMAFALGLGDEVVGVSYECDYPPEAKGKPVVIETNLDAHRMSSSAIDAVVTEHYQSHKSLYRVNVDLLHLLQPDLILAQELCPVCAASNHEVEEALNVLAQKPQVILLNPKTLSDVLDDLLRVGEATGRLVEAEKLAAELRERIERVKAITAKVTHRPKVFCCEWLDPLFTAGHWVPEMVALAGGEDGLGKVGEPSFKVSWEAVRDYAPEVIVLMPCGFTIERTMKELHLLTFREGWHQLPAVRAGRVFAVDANSYFSRPAPRLVRGLEILAHILHPELFHDGFSEGEVRQIPNS